MIDSQTSLYCIFGNPVIHSKSPDIHNVCFRKYHINAVYLAFKIDSISQGVQAIKSLNIKGVSITIPFKESIIKHLDWIDPEADKIGAVNTIVKQNGKLNGFNTDYQAAVSPLKPFGIQGRKVCIIGAGGAAQAVAFGIHKNGGDITIINRNSVKGEKLALKYNGRFISLEEIKTIQHIQPDIIINTTSMGMAPDIEESPIPEHLLDAQMIVMDIVYNPLNTKLLQDAIKKGCTIIDGLSMFIHQGAAQFKLWTDISPDINLMRQTVLNGDD